MIVTVLRDAGELLLPFDHVHGGEAEVDQVQEGVDDLQSTKASVGSRI